jgi:hypothetical protein
VVHGRPEQCPERFALRGLLRDDGMQAVLHCRCVGNCAALGKLAVYEHYTDKLTQVVSLDLRSSQVWRGMLTGSAAWGRLGVARRRWVTDMP